MQVGITAWQQRNDFHGARTSAIFHDRHMGQHGDLGDPICEMHLSWNVITLTVMHSDIIFEVYLNLFWQLW